MSENHVRVRGFLKDDGSQPTPQEFEQQRESVRRSGRAEPSKGEPKFSFEKELATQGAALNDDPERLEQLEKIAQKRPSPERLAHLNNASLEAQNQNFNRKRGN